MNQAEELIGKLNEIVEVRLWEKKSADGLQITPTAEPFLNPNKAYEVIRRYFAEKSDKSTKLITAWAEVMGDLSAKAVNGKIDLDDTKKTISHYIGSVLDEISKERGECE